MLLPILRRWDRQPPASARLLPSLRQRGSVLFLANHRALDGAPYSEVGTINRTATQHGVAAQPSSTSDYISAGRVRLLDASGAAILIAFIPRTTSQRAFAGTRSSGLELEQVLLNANSGSDPSAGRVCLVVRDSSGGLLRFATTNAVLTLNKLHVLLFEVIDGQNGRITLDGVEQAVTHANSGTYGGSGLSANSYDIGNQNGNGSHTSGGGADILLFARFHSRAFDRFAITTGLLGALSILEPRRTLVPIGASPISAGVSETLSLTESASFPPAPFIPLLRSQHRLPRPVMRTGSVLRGADREPTWQIFGTTGNLVRKPGGTEGGHIELQGSVAVMQVSSTPVSVLNFTVLARIRFDTSPSGNAFGIGNAGNANQHYLSISSSGPTMTFVVYGFNGSTNTNAFSDPVSFTTGRFYNLAITSRPGRVEIWLDGVKVASTANSMVSEVHTMTHTVLGGVMNAGTPAASTLASSVAALLTLSGTTVPDNRLREITADPRGIHKLFERRAEVFILPQIIGNTYNDEVSEAVILSETSAAANATSAAQSESTTLSDSQASTMAAIAARSEALALSDSQAAAAIFAVTMPEALALTDGQAVTATLLGAAGEALALSDVPAAILAAVATIAEPLALADTQNGFSGEAQVSESLALVDTRGATAELPAARAEALALSDASSNTAAQAATQSESIALAEAPAAIAALVAQHLEALALSDTVAVGAVTITASLAEALALAAACDGVVMTINVGGVDATFYVVMEDNTLLVQMEDATISVLAEDTTVMVA